MFKSRKPQAKEQNNGTELRDMGAVAEEKHFTTGSSLVAVQPVQNKLNALPKMILPVISSYLNTYDQSALVSSSKTIHGFLQPNRMLAPLLRSVVTGNQDRVIQILSRYPQLVVSQGRVTDNSGRIFLKASAAELVRWCGDLRYMANAMLNILKSLPNKILAEQIKAKWVALDEAYDLNGGLDYVLSGSTQPSKSLAFSLAPLLKELQAYIDNFDTMNWAQKEAQWCTKVGAEQFLLTAIYLQHYCNPDVPFYPTPSFDKPTFRRSLEFYNYSTGARQSVWGDNADLLGRNFAVTRAWGRVPCRPSVLIDPAAPAGRDLVALRACEERTGLDLLAFKRELQEPLNLQLIAEQRSSHCSIS